MTVAGSARGKSPFMLHPSARVRDIFATIITLLSRSASATERRLLSRKARAVRKTLRIVDAVPSLKLWEFGRNDMK